MGLISFTAACTNSAIKKKSLHGVFSKTFTPARPISEHWGYRELSWVGFPQHRSRLSPFVLEHGAAISSWRTKGKRDPQADRPHKTPTGRGQGPNLFFPFSPPAQTDAFSPPRAPRGYFENFASRYLIYLLEPDLGRQNLLQAFGFLFRLSQAVQTGSESNCSR